MSKMQEELTAQIQELKQALDHIKTLQGILPVCSLRKKNDDRAYWNQVEEYISRHSNALFTQSICPGCIKTHYSEFVKDSDSDKG